MQFGGNSLFLFPICRNRVPNEPFLPIFAKTCTIFLIVDRVEIPRRAAATALAVHRDLILRHYQLL